jgi:glycyl-tRNA synthetase beta subunit
MLCIYDKNDKKVVLKKNGNHIARYTYSVNRDLPKISISGNEYVFNSKLIDTTYFSKSDLCKLFKD